MHNERWTTTTTTTTTLRTKRSIYIHIMCNFQLRRQITVRHILLRCTPLVEASGGQEEYYIRSSWLWVILQVRLTFSQMHPIRGIQLSRAVKCKVNLTFYRMQLRRQLTVRCTPFGRGIWWPRAVLSWKVWSVQFFSHLLFTCWRSKSYIAMQEIRVIENWAIYVDWSFVVAVVVVIVVVTV